MEKVLVIKKVLIGLVSGLLFAFFAVRSSYAASYSYKNYGSTDYLGMDQFNQIVNVLAAASGDDTEQDTTPIHATGIAFGTFGEAVAAEETFKFLYMGEKGYGITIEREGTSGYFHDSVRNEEGWSYSTCCHGGYGAYEIYVGWLPGSDPATCVAEHNAAMEMIHSIIASVPEDSISAYRYFNDWLCRNANYDFGFNESSYSGYGALCTGSSVCAGYAKAFMALCYHAGKYCITVNGTKDGGRHSWNAVWDGNTYKWVDVTWADQNGWIDYCEFMSNMDDSWVNYFNEPFCTMV